MEFGSGASTIFYAKRANSIVAVEHDKEWYNNIEKILPENAKLIHQDLEYDGEYCIMAHQIGNFL